MHREILLLDELVQTAAALARSWPLRRVLVKRGAFLSRADDAADRFIILLYAALLLFFYLNNTLGSKLRAEL